MNYTEAAGRFALGAGALGLGVISLLYADFAITWQPVPDWTQREARSPTQAAVCSRRLVQR